MQKPLTLLASAAFCVALALPAGAEEAPNLDTVVATVNETEITLGHMIVARATLPEQYQQLPDEVLFKGILDQLIQQTALSDLFEGELPARARLSLENEQRSVTAGEMINAIMSEPVAEADLKAAYEAQYLNAEAEKEFNASHILVETEEEAQALKVLLDDGADFAETAREKSTGPSGPGGGSLGWFGPGMMVPAFEQAVMAMDVDGISDPVQTQFGWHVIKLNETRILEVPAFEDLREDLELELRQTRVEAQVDEMTAKATIDRAAAEGLDPSLLKNLNWLE